VIKYHHFATIKEIMDLGPLFSTCGLRTAEVPKILSGVCAVFVFSITYQCEASFSSVFNQNNLSQQIKCRSSCEKAAVFY